MVWQMIASEHGGMLGRGRLGDIGSKFVHLPVTNVDRHDVCADIVIDLRSACSPYTILTADSMSKNALVLR
jgi:hypothetical protein